MPRRERRAWQRDQHPTIQCAHCHKWYPNAFPGTPGPTTQGWRCAARYVNGTVYGHFGSVLADGCAFPVTAPGLPPTLDPVCDACLQRWIDVGYAPDPTTWAAYNDFDFDTLAPLR